MIIRLRSNGFVRSRESAQSQINDFIRGVKDCVLAFGDHTNDDKEPRLKSRRFPGTDQISDPREHALEALSVVNRSREAAEKFIAELLVGQIP
jgi:hypothetical protein